jgi:hypothetical protein
VKNNGMKSEILLNKVCASLDALISIGEKYHGLFPSLLDRNSKEMLRELPSPIDGQRNGDRSHLGCNLIHDQSLLRTISVLGCHLGRSDYTKAVDSYLDRFAKHCTHTASGLFPWGEHSFWHLTKDCVGNSYDNEGRKSPNGATHDHLRFVPKWLWDKLYSLNSEAVVTFAKALQYHWSEGEPQEYFRHTSIDMKIHPVKRENSCDFPRHSGFYIYDWSFAYAKTKDEFFLKHIEKMLDYWWNKKDDNNLLLAESRSPSNYIFYQTNSTSQTLSLATTLMESAEILSSCHSSLADKMRARSISYYQGVLSLPHDFKHNRYINLFDRKTNETKKTVDIWGSKYGQTTLQEMALLCLCLFRFTKDKQLLSWALKAGDCIFNTPFPQEGTVPIKDAGLAIELFADLFSLTKDRKWRTKGFSLINDLFPIYCDEILPRGASNITWYESQLGSGIFLHALTRMALLNENIDSSPLEPDYTYR